MNWSCGCVDMIKLKGVVEFRMLVEEEYFVLVLV